MSSTSIMRTLLRLGQAREAAPRRQMLNKTVSLVQPPLTRPKLTTASPRHGDGDPCQMFRWTP